MAIRDSMAVRGRRVEFGNGTAVVFSSEVVGEAQQWLPSPGRLRITRTPAEKDVPPEVRNALDEHEAIEQEVSSFTLAQIPGGDVAEISPAGGVPDGFAQVVLYEDESGALSWHFGVASTDRTIRGVERKRFRIPMRTQTARATNSLRMQRDGSRALGFLGRKIFRIILLPISGMLGRPVRALVEQWEKHAREEMLRTLTVDDLRRPDPPRFTDWESIAGRRALLVVHGIFSSTRGMLSRLDPFDLRRLSEQYEGRVLAFDHFTLSRSPEENVRWLVNELRQRAPERTFAFDVLCHSRGGIVARTLRERAREFDPSGIARVEKIFFAATPNHGSALADPDRILDLIDIFTNIGAVVTGGSAAIALEIVFGLLKVVAHAAITQIPGIRAMGRGPDDSINKVLNAATIERPTDYASVAANYEPSDAHEGALMTIADSVVDRVFGRDIANDLVVPTEGVFTGLGKQKFDIPHHTYKSGLWHTELFGETLTIDNALEHFRGANEPREILLAGTSRDVLLALGDETRAPRRKRKSATRGRVEKPFEAGFPVDEMDVGAARGARPEMASFDPPAPAPPPVAPAPVPAAAPEVSLERDPQIEFREKVKPGVEENLTVRLDERAQDSAPSDDLLNIVVPEGRDSIDIVAQLFAQGFDIQGQSHARMTVRRNRVAADETATFTLVANPVAKTTRRQIIVGFSIDGIPIGGTSFTTTVLGAGEADEEPPPFKPTLDPRSADRADADLKLIVSDLSDDGSHYSLKATSKLRGFVFESRSFGEFTAPNGILEIVNETLKTLFSERPSRRLSEADFAVALTDWNARMIDTLCTLGMDLWSFLPETFRGFYFELHDAGVAPRSIHIISDDMLFPWELVIPHRVAGGKKIKLAPLGSAHIVGRWRPGLTILPDPQALLVNQIAILNPIYTAPDKKLPASEKEATDLAAFFGNENVAALLVRPSKLADVQKNVLDANGIQLLHFTGHAMFHEANPNSSALLLEGDELLTASKLANADFTAGAPIIIINACSVGKAGMVASRAGGFAERCLSNGCAAVLAAYWEISDRSAAAFSGAFYEKLKGGRTFGEALQELRIEHEDDPTFHAYTFFGDPLSRIVLSHDVARSMETGANMNEANKPNPDPQVEEVIRLLANDIRSADQRIIGGDEVPAGQFLSTCCLGSFGEYFCTGILVHPRVVVTAAHCEAGLTSAFFGGPNIPPLGGTETPVDILEVIIHPDNDSSAFVRNDISVVILKEACKEKPTAIATTQEIAAARETELVGFGYSDPKRPVGFGTKRRVNVPIAAMKRNGEDMSTLEQTLGFSSKHEYVAGRKLLGRDSCNGDSGGPSFIKVGGQHKVAGVTSRATLEATDNAPCGNGGIYVRLDAYLDWIKSVAKEHGIVM